MRRTTEDGGTECPWCGDEIDLDAIDLPDDERDQAVGYGPSIHIGKVVAMHAACAEEANADG